MVAKSKKLRSFNKRIREDKDQPNRTEGYNNGNVFTEIKNTLEGTSIRLNETKQINELEDRVVMLPKIRRKRMKINEDSLRDLWNNRKNFTNICIIKIPEGERVKDLKIFEEIIDEKLP